MFSTGVPILVIILMEDTTYGESVISMPILERGLPTGPIENGMTYIVLPETVRLLYVHIYS